MSSSASSIKSALNVLGWAVFLGASWTWCIGMFLPVLLVRDYGFWGWVVFAVPNVVGAAAMAWVLPDAAASRKVVAEHGAACRWFSVVTLGFNAGFLFLILGTIINPNVFHSPYWGPASAFFFLVALPLVIVFTFAPKGHIAAAAVSVIFSWTCALLFFSQVGNPFVNMPMGADLQLIGVGLVCAFGFTLCPYLDLTFHEARQATSPADGRAAFAVGFGIVFFSMIVFSLGYGLHADHIYGMSLIYVLAHILCQLTLKLLLHGRALLGKRAGALTAIAIILLIIASGSRKLFEPLGFEYHGVKFYEIIYRCFLAFYGLVFPAYVWLCMIRKRGIPVWAISVLIAAPMYWMGFIERQTWWLGPGVGVVLLAGLMPRIAPKILKPERTA